MREGSVELRLPGFADGECPELRIFCDGPLEQFIYRRLEESQPSVEVSGLQGVFCVQVEVLLYRIPPVRIGVVEQQELPEGVHNRQVVFPVDVGHIVENIPDNLVIFHLFIKSVNEQADICRQLYVRFCLHDKRYSARFGLVQERKNGAPDKVGHPVFIRNRI